MLHKLDKFIKNKKIPSRLYYADYYSKENKFTFNQWAVKIFSSFWSNFTGINWQNVLAPKIVDAKRYESFKGDSWGLTIEDDIDSILPNLYSISQAKWDKYLKTLDLELVDVLNLSKHRHLWEAYNFVQMKPKRTDQLAIAELIGKHHFILSMIKMNQADLIAILSKNRLFTLDEVKDLEANLKLCIEELHQGRLNNELMQKLHPSFTAKFLHKVSHCVKFSEIVNLADSVLSYSSSLPNYLLGHYLLSPKPSTERMIKAVNWLPNSTIEPLKFGKSLKLSKKFQEYPGLFFRSRPQWLNYDSTLLSSIKISEYKDYLTTLYMDLVAPQIMQACEVKNIDPEKCIKRGLRQFEKMITETLTLDQLKKLSESWHRNLTHIEKLKPARSMQRWNPLIANTMIDDISIQALTSSELLKAHGEEMNHCVKGYAERCLNNQINILEFKDPNNEKSTIELGYERTTQIYSNQHRAYDNRNPPTKHLRAAKQLIAKMNSGELPLNMERVFQAPVKYADRLSYDFRDLELREQIYQAYKAKEILPTKLIASNYQELIVKTGLNDFVDEIINKVSLYGEKVKKIRSYEYSTSSLGV